MKVIFCSIFALLAGVVPISAITVTTPAPGARVTSPFNLVASTSTCDSVPAVSLGYSIDEEPATIVPTSFNAMLTAEAGEHTVHVKCWGHHAHEEKTIKVDVVSSGTGPSAAATPALSPPAGTYSSQQSVTLSDATAGATIYYTTDGSAPTASSTEYSSPIAVSASAVIEADAVAPGYAHSDLATADYVIPASSSPGPTVPPNAIVASDLQLRDTWHWNHDAGTPGAATGRTTLVDTPSLSGSARQFISEYSDSGGEIYAITYASDVISKNFVYDNWVWIDEGSQIANLEMDSNQVIANGDTIIYAFQCDYYSKVWDYSGPGAHWVHSTQYCDVRTWTTNAWHHVQISYSRDDLGYVTYHSVWLDGVEQVINARVPSAFALGWRIGVVQTQFQMDGLGASGSSTDYADNLTISRW